MNSLIDDFLVAGVSSECHWHPGKYYIINLKLTKYSRWKLSGWLEYNLGRLELTVITGQYAGK